MDPAHGEISRAMRNRGIEICILSEVSCGNLYMAIIVHCGNHSTFLKNIRIYVCTFVCHILSPFYTPFRTFLSTEYSLVKTVELVQNSLLCQSIAHSQPLWWPIETSLLF